MNDRTRHPAYALHALVFLLDRAADEILPRLGLTYSRYLTLLTVERLGGSTQRAIAEELRVSEPAMSRSIRGLEEAGLLATPATAGSGNRRSVVLTDKGERVVAEAADHLEESFAALLHHAGVTDRQVLDVTTPLLQAITRETGA